MQIAYRIIIIVTSIQLSKQFFEFSVVSHKRFPQWG